MNSDDLISRWAPTLNQHSGGGSDSVATTQEHSAPTQWAMVAFYLDDALAQELAVAGGEAPEELHLTLAYLGVVDTDIPADKEHAVIDAVTAWARTVEPVMAGIGGVGFFNHGVTYASVDGATLPQIRQDLVEHLAAAGVSPASEYGFTPHVTLAYESRRDVDVPTRELQFTQVAVAFAGRRTVIDLTGRPQALTVTDRPTGPAEVIEPVAETVKAFVADVNGRTVVTGPATASLREPTVDDIANEHLLWMHGKFVGAELPNRNGALWSAGDLEMSAGSVTNGPLNWLHEARHVIGTLAESQYVNAVKTGPTGLESAAEGGTVQPHLTATAAIWKWIWPDEAFVIQQASEMKQLWYSMECISKEVTCAGENGCGNTTSYANYMSGAACEHVNQRASVRQFVNPVFLGGAVIVPPTRPGWAEADASVMTKASGIAEAAFEQAGEPDVATSDWEQMMAQLVRFTEK